MGETAAHIVEVFTGSGCTHCAAATKLLADRGVEFVDRSLDDTGELEEFRRRLPRVTAIPQIFVDGEHIGSTEDLAIRAQRADVPFGAAS